MGTLSAFSCTLLHACARDVVEPGCLRWPTPARRDRAVPSIRLSRSMCMLSGDTPWSSPLIEQQVYGVTPEGLAGTASALHGYGMRPPSLPAARINESLIVAGDRTKKRELTEKLLPSHINA